MSKATLDRHIAQTEATGYAISITKKSGASSILTDEEQQIAIGFVYHQNAINAKVGPKQLKAFVNKKLIGIYKIQRVNP